MSYLRQVMEGTWSISSFHFRENEFINLKDTELNAYHSQVGLWLNENHKVFHLLLLLLPDLNESN